MIATVSSAEKAALATRAGAEFVLDYRAADAASRVLSASPGGVDLVVEVAPGANQLLDSAVIAPHGTIAAYANDGGVPYNPPMRDFMKAGIRVQFLLVYTMPEAAKDEAVAAVTAAVDDGAISVGEEHGLPLHRYPLDEVAQAHATSESGVVGKVLIDVS